VLDARLLPAAAACWGTTIVAVEAGWRVGLVLAAGLLVLAGGVVVFARVWNAKERQCAPVVWAVLAATVAGAGFAAAGAWQDHGVAVHPLRTAARGTYLTATVVPEDDPKPLPAKPFGGRQWMMRAQLRTYQHGEVPVRAGGAVIVVTPGPGWVGLLPGQTVQFRARLERPWRRDLTVAVLQADGPPTAVGPASWWQRAAGTVRAHFAVASARALPPDAAGLLPGLVDGDVSRLPDHVRDDFKKTDLTHLVAVSGTNVSIILASVLVSVRMLGVDMRWGAALAALVLIAFVILARPSPTVLRAAVMGAIALVGLVTGRRKQALPALCTAVIGLIGYSPMLAVDIGFALSVLATAGLILLAPGWSRWLEERGWHRIPAEAFAVATAAFLLTVPMIVALTGHVGFLAIVANVLVEPVIAPITVAGTVGAILSCVWMPAAQVVLYLTGPPLWWLLFISGRGASLGISLSVPDGVGGGVSAAAVVAVLIAVFARSVPGPDRDEDGETATRERSP
jgi:competence protein ComEC